MENSNLNPSPAPEEQQVHEASDNSKVLKEANALKTSLKMVSKVTDNDRLEEGETDINAMLPRIDARINEIKAEGVASTDVRRQRKLYSEGMELEAVKKSLKDKLIIVRKNLNELTDDQKKWLGITVSNQDNQDQ